MIPSRREILVDKIRTSAVQGFDEELAMDIFNYQYKANPILRSYVQSLMTEAEALRRTEPIYLPISAFKTYAIQSGTWQSEHIFTSSGTTGATVSMHLVYNRAWYLESCVRCWQEVMGSVTKYRYLCLLPGYMEREGSSLIEMMRYFCEVSHHESGFYLRNHEELYQALLDSQQKQIPTVLFGVSYGLLDFIETYSILYPELIVMETGGMKGRRAEMLKSELHKLIKDGFGVSQVYGEYGMTELFSQAYSVGEELFVPSKTMQVKVSEITDPFRWEKIGKAGIIHITDLANIDTCSFIQTEDLGIIHPDGSFNLQGRLDYADIRGCNLMVE